MPRKQIVLLSVWAMLSSTSAWAADWPQFLGPNRDGHSLDTGLLRDWPAGGPKLKWKIVDLGDAQAFSAPSVANGRIYLFTVAGGDELVTALDEKDGAKVWVTKVGKIGANKDMYPYEGPRSTPTVAGDKIYALGSNGDLVCLDSAKGNKIWAKSLTKDFSGNPGYWAYSESPLVDGDVVIVSPGGATAAIVALNKNDGNLLWKSAVPAGMAGKKGLMSAYGSPIRAETGGIKQYICVLSTGLVGVSATDGKFLWRYDKVANAEGINIATPVYHDGQVFSVVGYGKGGGLVKLTANQGKVTAEDGWLSKDLATAQSIGSFIRVGEHLYGTAAAGKAGKGGGGTQLVCVELKTGNIVWKNPSVGVQGALCEAEGMLYVRGENGKVALVEATPAGYKEHGSMNLGKAGKRPVWPYPVVANGCLYLRDTGTLACYDVRDPKK